MAINFDFSDVESSSFEPLPAGKYHAVIFEAEERESNSSEHNYLSIQFKILEGKDDAGNSAVNRRVWGNYSFSPKALFRLMSLLQAVGYPEEELKSKNFVLEPSELQGNLVKIALGRRKYEGEIQNTVRGEAAPDEDFDPEAAQAPEIDTSAPSDAPSLDAVVDEDELPFKVE